MSRPLHACIVGLVLVNLAFVHITEAARWTWLGPLVLLTVFSPWLLRLTRFWAYRLLWNLAVLGVFGLLVHHVTYFGVAHLLEDGLLLAALCQVHLVNNLSRMQKPDLIFFNSFLIAVVTSYLSLALGYSVVFLVYAPLLIVSMQLLTLSRAEPSRRVVRRAVWEGFRRSAVVLGLTLLVFLFWPRDFHRKGVLGDTLQFTPPEAIAEVAFSDNIDLGRTGKVFASDRVVMRVALQSGTPADVPTHWRGATLDRFDGDGWKAAPGAYAADPWRITGHRAWERGGNGHAAVVEVHLADPDAPRLFAPLASGRLQVQTKDVRMRVDPLPDLNFRCWRVRDRRPIRYAIGVGGARPEPGGKSWTLSKPIVTHIRPGPVPKRARSIAKDIRKGLPDDVEQHEVVEKIRQFLAGRYDYLAPGAEGGARNLDEFLDAEAGAHCEYFATALALMLRTRGIPCRVVTGYRSDEWDENGELLTVRARHAHAWVEVLDPEGGWYTVDATPAAGGGPATATGLFARIRNAASGLWAGITGFNHEARDRVYAWIANVPARAREQWHAVLLVVGGGVLVCVFVYLRRRGRVEAAIRDYHGCLKRLGLALAPGETPRELLLRASLADDGRASLRAATDRHESSRYRVA